MRSYAGPFKALSNGVRMPAIGLGVFETPPEQTAAAVAAAIGEGYRLIDTAAAYFNEREVGEGIRRTGIARQDMFVTTKLWPSDYGYEQALRAFDTSLRCLQLDYVDLYLLHWPVPQDFAATVAAYQAAERLLQEGRVRAIGVSNFSAGHLEALIENTSVRPTVNQIELHPLFAQRDLRAIHERLGIVTQSWSPIGGVYKRYGDTSHTTIGSLLEHRTIVGLGAKYRKTAAQVVLRWHLDHGLSAIPKSARFDRIAENADLFDFALAAADVAAIDALDTGVRGGPSPEAVSAVTLPIRSEWRSVCARR